MQICELGNLAIHVALRNLRPPGTTCTCNYMCVHACKCKSKEANIILSPPTGTKERKIPYPTSNPLTVIFNYVSCPNYTYEVGTHSGMAYAKLVPYNLVMCYNVIDWCLAGVHHHDSEHAR